MGSSWSDVNDDSASEDGRDDALRWEGNHYHPTASDVDVVRDGLIRLGLPTELALYILDLAEYWVREVLCERAVTLSVTASGSPKNSSTWCYLASPPLARRPKKIRFYILSHDQGWGGPVECQGTFRGSFSWTEVALMRPRRATFDSEKQRPQPPTRSMSWVRTSAQENSFVENTSDDPNDIALDDPHYEAVSIDGRTHAALQYNRVAVKHSERHVVEWREDDEGGARRWGERSEETGAGYGGGFVRAIEEGDRIAVFARAQYPGWANHVEGVRMEIFTSRY
ncbi:hypothetical protein HDZ31DRAFT_32061 [Schizophyllum fasciatum]